VPRVLVIEDDRDLGRILKASLERAGFPTRWEVSGVAGLTALREDPPDLLVLDLGLPDLDGDEILARVRATADIPVLILTATRDLERKVALLREGADDYLEKPFHPEELFARLEALWRRKVAGRRYRVGALLVDREAQRVYYRDRRLSLSPTELELLALLARRPGRVFSREEIVAAVWPEDPPRSNALEVHMAKLRAKLAEAGARGYLRTVRGRGYALVEPRG